MKSKSIHTIGVAMIAVGLGLAGCGRQAGDDASNLMGPTATGASGDPATTRISFPFDATNFSNPVNNAFFPLTAGAKWSYVNVTPEGIETNDVEVTRQTKTILGVRVRVISDRVYLNGSLKEDTFDWYAADNQGNVWYFGEDTKEVENGVVVSTQGSWEAGKAGAQAGLIMLADPQVGDTYYQENAPGVVADQGKVMSLKESVSVPFGDFAPCLQTADWTHLEPGNRSFKYYASGIGVVLEVSPSGPKERVELTSFTSH